MKTFFSEMKTPKSGSRTPYWKKTAFNLDADNKLNEKWR